MAIAMPTGLRYTACTPLDGKLSLAPASPGCQSTERCFERHIRSCSMHGVGGTTLEPIGTCQEYGCAPREVQCAAAARVLRR